MLMLEFGLVGHIDGDRLQAKAIRASAKSVCAVAEADADGLPPSQESKVGESDLGDGEEANKSKGILKSYGAVRKKAKQCLGELLKATLAAASPAAPKPKSRGRKGKKDARAKEGEEEEEDDEEEEEEEEE
eukprot:3144689-Alexandrium_andersonii.AAC.1